MNNYFEGKMKFIDRKSDISYLEKEYMSLNPNFVVIYGRRRVGKTRLLKEFIKEKPHIYFLCDKELEVNQLSTQNLTKYLEIVSPQ